MTIFEPQVNRATTTLQVAHTLGDGQLVVWDASKFASFGRLTCYQGNGLSEDVYCILAYSSVDYANNTFTISGAVEGTADANLSAKTRIEARATAAQANLWSTAINALENSGPGQQGPQGVAGPQGSTGAIGSQGYQGLAGSTGATGAIGTQGYQGNQGATGIQGAAGAQGAQGRQGFQGTNGSNGLQGNQGVAGTNGATGSQGYQGNQGVAGTNGSNGSQGSQGSQGVAGLQGANGAQGFQGYQGNQGTQGFQGNQGTQGFQGNQGRQGYQGNQGVTGTGTQGPQGSSGGGTGGTPGGSNTQFQYNNSGSFDGASNVTYSTNSSTLEVKAISSGIVPLRVDCVASQTANAIEVYDESGALGMYVAHTGEVCAVGRLVNEATTQAGIHFGYGPGGDSPRALFCNGAASSNWQIDNYNGIFRWFVPGSTCMTLNNSGGLSVSSSISTYNLIASGGLTVHDKVGIGTTNPTFGLHQIGGSYHLQAIIPPTPTITQHGTAGAATWYYWIVVQDRAGNYTGLGPTGTTTTSNSTLSSSNYNVINFSRIDGAYKYVVVRASSDGLDPGWYIGKNSMIAGVLDDGSSSYTVNDQVYGDPFIFGGPISVINQTANATIDGNLTIGDGDDATTLTINAGNENQNLIDIFQVNGASGAQCGIDQNCCIRTSQTTGMPSGDPIDIGAMTYDPATGYMWIASNSGWLPLMPNNANTNNPPDLSTFTPYGYAISATGQSFQYRTKAVPNSTYLYYTSLNAGAHQPAAYVKPIPSSGTAWTAIARVQGNVGPGWAASCGLCILESSTGKMIVFGPVYNYGKYAANAWGLTVGTTSPGGSYSSSVYSSSQTYEAQWLKLHYDSSSSTSSVSAYISVDGVDFTYVTSLPFSGNFTTGPDSVGIGANVYVGYSNDSNNRGGWNISNWSLYGL